MRSNTASLGRLHPLASESNPSGVHWELLRQIPRVAADSEANSPAMGNFPLGGRLLAKTAPGLLQVGLGVDIEEAEVAWVDAVDRSFVHVAHSHRLE